MHLIILMFNTSMIPYISIDQYLNPNSYTIPNMQNMRFFCCPVYIYVQLSKHASNRPYHYLVWKYLKIYCNMWCSSPFTILFEHLIIHVSRCLVSEHHIVSICCRQGITKHFIQDKSHTIDATKHWNRITTESPPSTRQLPQLPECYM